MSPAALRLLARLPALPCSVLVLGVDAGALMDSIAALGHTVERLDAAALASADSAQAAPRAQVLLLAGALPGCTPLQVFDAAHRLLASDGASIVMLEAFVTERHDCAASAAPLLEHVCRLAERCGWRIEHDEALEMPSRPGLRLLHWVRSDAAGAHLLPLDDARAPAMRMLFEQVFGRTMSEAEWRWKYSRGQGVGLSRGGEMLAFYGGLTRPLRLFGRDALGCQICDVMVSAQANRHLARRGPLHQVAATFLEAHIGWGLRHEVGFGFPNDRHLRVAERLGLYERVDEMLQLAWQVADTRRGNWRWRTEVLPASVLLQGSALWRDLERAWQQMAAAFRGSALGVRDPAWWRYRFVDKPGVAHELLLLGSRWSRRWAAAMVVRRHEDALEVLDVVGAPEHFAALLRGAQRHARALRLASVSAWITASHADKLAAGMPPDRIDKLELHIPANAHTAGVPPSALRGRWFLMSGDTDFR